MRGRAKALCPDRGGRCHLHSPRCACGGSVRVDICCGGVGGGGGRCPEDRCGAEEREGLEHWQPAGEQATRLMPRAVGLADGLWHAAHHADGSIVAGTLAMAGLRTLAVAVAARLTHEGREGEQPRRGVQLEQSQMELGAQQ